MSFLKEYTLLAELGKGGFAKVYKVRHNELGYIRAIRVLNETVTDENSAAYQKFLRECKVLLRLGNGSHPNIVHIYQPRLLESHALVEMDFVDGTDISRYLSNNSNFLPANEVLRMVQQISSAIAYCHEDIYKFCIDPDEDKLENDPMDGSKWSIDDATRQRLIKKYKVIHNDIHSGNIMRREDGNFVLLDFGLAITGSDDVRNSSRHENGAVEYKAPEKWDNDALLTEQSDVYSFGVVMYEYLAGRVPFPFDKSLLNKTEATFKLNKAHKEQTPPPIFDLRKAYFEAKYPGRTYKKDYPDWLEEAIMRCLEKNPAKRFRNGKELHQFVMAKLQEEINRKKATSPTSPKEPVIAPEKDTVHTNGTPSQPSPKKMPWYFIVLSAVGVAAIVLLALNLRKPKETPSPTSPTTDAAIQRQNDSLKEMVEDLKNDLNELQHNSDANDLLSAKQREIEKLQKEAQERIADWETERQAKDDTIQSLRKDLTQQTELVKQKEKTIKSRDDAIKQKDKTIEEKNRKIQQKENEVSDLNDKLINCLNSD